MSIESFVISAQAGEFSISLTALIMQPRCRYDPFSHSVYSPSQQALLDEGEEKLLFAVEGGWDVWNIGEGEI